MSLQNIASILEQHPALSSLGFHGLTSFLRMARLARPLIEFQQKDKRQPPSYLHLGLIELLAGSLSEPDLNLVQLCWTAFKEIIWNHPEVLPTENEVLQYNKAALIRGTSFSHLFPPVRVCQVSGCPNHRDSNDEMTLTEPMSHKATLYTLRNGALPVYSTSLYCRKCNRRYYHNYYVHKLSSMRTYYGGVPHAIQVAQHFFMDSPLLELFSNGMVFGWLSSSNWARIYNTALAGMHPHITNNPVAFACSLQPGPITPSGWNLDIRNEDVLNGFLLYSLLLEKAERREILTLPHDEANHKDRLQPALAARNKSMEGVGQEAYPHACDLCFFVFEAEDGTLMKIQTAHCDGDTIGHRCCKVHDCKIPLASNRQHFCPDHQDMKLICAVTDCQENSADGFKTCEHPDHRALEKAYFTRGKSLYKLRSRLKKTGVAVPANSVPDGADDDDDDEVIIESGRHGPEQVDCEGKPEGGNRRLRAYFGSRRTHNEQLIMRCCGVILSRATLYGSEAVSSVNEFAKATFPTPESTPEYFVFDNNCKLDAHQRAIGDRHFENTGKPVDVFHFTCKHKLTDHHCQLYCNPAAFPELIDEDGNWRFNTSICEQTNVWFGGYIALVRDMEVTRYNFFLDEMIKRRNRHVIKDLAAKGHSPWSVPVEILFPNQS